MGKDRGLDGFMRYCSKCLLHDNKKTGGSIKVIRPPKPFQFVGNVIPILHGECTWPHHHDGHGDVVVGTIDIRVPKPVTQVERLALFSLLQVVANLGGTLHIQNKRLTFISFNELSENLLAIAFASQFLSHGKVPEPIE